MRKIRCIAIAIAVMLFVCVPTVAFAADGARDTQTEEVTLVAADPSLTEGSGAAGDARSSAPDGSTSGSSTSGGSTPGTGDDTSSVAAACFALGASALAAAGLAARYSFGKLNQA